MKHKDLILTSVITFLLLNPMNVYAADILDQFIITFEGSLEKICVLCLAVICGLCEVLVLLFVIRTMNQS